MKDKIDGCRQNRPKWTGLTEKGKIDRNNRSIQTELIELDRIDQNRQKLTDIDKIDRNRPNQSKQKINTRFRLNRAKLTKIDVIGKNRQDPKNSLLFNKPSNGSELNLTLPLYNEIPKLQNEISKLIIQL